MTSKAPVAALLVGNESLLIHCAETCLSAGHQLVAVISNDRSIRGWAEGNGVPLIPHDAELQLRLRATTCDLLLSVGNRRLLHRSVLDTARLAAINFHDGPLPRYSGLNAPNWAIFDGAASHGVAWHLMTDRADAGAVLSSRSFEIAPDETARTLNARCFEAGIDSFDELLSLIAARNLSGRILGIDEATRHGRADIPLGCAEISFALPASRLSALARSLDFGQYPNPMALPRLAVGKDVFAVRHIAVEPAASGILSGTIIDANDNTILVACSDGAVRLSAILDARGAAVNAHKVAGLLAAPSAADIHSSQSAPGGERARLLRDLSSAEDFWTDRLTAGSGDLEIWRSGDPEIRRSGDPEAGKARERVSLPIPGDVLDGLRALATTTSIADVLVAAHGAFLARRASNADASEAKHFHLAYSNDALAQTASAHRGWVAEYVPLRFARDTNRTFAEAMAETKAELALVQRQRTFAFDLPLRIPGATNLNVAPTSGTRVAIHCSQQGNNAVPLASSALTIFLSDETDQVLWDYDPSILPADLVATLSREFLTFLRAVAADPGRDCGAVVLLSDNERATVDLQATHTSRDVDLSRCVHDLIHEYAQSHPERVALHAPDGTATYGHIEARSNQLARLLRERGVKRGDRVAVAFERSLDTVVSVLAVLKAGAAYVPIDPAHPAERSAMILEDCGAELLLTHSQLVGHLPTSAVPVLALDEAALLLGPQSSARLQSPVTSADLAYVIYTSGSTGKSKGVMVEHRNVANLFAALDERIPVDDNGVWLAVTSLSFDISVLELLWTLTRGFTVVLHREGSARVAATRESDSRVSMDFSLFYFSADAGESGASSYNLLLEGARFADAHGFTAVWTPERHFHEFGGLYPNPAVTAAAVAAITKRIGIRAGSVVLPLHHPIRVVEDWSVVDNISGGRVGISFASGWQPNDFVIRPENFKDNKQRMIHDIDVVKRLWRGESIPFPGPLGKDVAVRTLPRPVQAELPAWITTAGNPDTYRVAGQMGLRVLTHLLGQTVDELAEKIAVYQEAWSAAGHAGTGYVTLMLHTFVDEDEQFVKQAVRAPLKKYLGSSVSLIKDFAATFPALKKPAHGGELDFKSLSAEEMDALLEYSAERYYETSGLFGPPAKCEVLVRKLVQMGVNEIACLIDFGVESELALKGLQSLNTLRARFEGVAPAGVEMELPSLPELMRRHSVTHMQCTPSLARVLVATPEAQAGLGKLKAMLVGGEALPPGLASELRATLQGELHNMYGPTETTVWSTSHRLDAHTETVPIGTAFANTVLYVVDEFGRLVRDGNAGELWIGGSGVARGYHNRPELTASRFLPDPFLGRHGARVYRTGDLVRRNAAGELEFLGRLDDQVKILGHRIELGEIEAILEQHPGVKQCAVVAAGDAESGYMLQAYLVGTAECPDASGLRAFLLARLPQAMIPSRFLRVAALPLNANGKIDRKALKSLSLVPQSVSAAAREPITGADSDLEQRIADVWREVLGVHEIGMLDNFFDIGGHSLMAVRVHSRLKKELSAELSITDLFRYSTVRALAAHISGGNGDDAAASLTTAARSRAAARREALRGRRPKAK